jgi:HAD superfamily hydrolase (TIGR01549 family)
VTTTRASAPPNEVAALLFDLDGTLIDTDDVMGEGLARKLAPISWLFPKGDPQPFARWLLMALEIPLNYMAMTMEHLGLARIVMSVADRTRRLKGLGTRDRHRLVPGAREVIEELAARYRLAVVTTRARPDADAFLRAHDLYDLFEVITTRSDVWRLKPHPAPVLRTVDALGVAPAQCWFIGDTNLDVLAGKRAGVFAVGVLTGFGEKRELERAGADLVLLSVVEIADHLP